MIFVINLNTINHILTAPSCDPSGGPGCAICDGMCLNILPLWSILATALRTLRIAPPGLDMIKKVHNRGYIRQINLLDLISYSFANCSVE